jgi:hypothetical protein
MMVSRQAMTRMLLARAPGKIRKAQPELVHTTG